MGDEDDHGTHAAGTIAATRKAMGIAGIADNKYVKIMPLKVLGTDQGDRGGGGCPQCNSLCRSKWGLDL